MLMMRVILILMVGIVAGLIPSRPLASTSGDNLIKFGLDPIRDDQAVKKDGKNRVTLHLEPQNPSVFSGQNTG